MGNAAAFNDFKKLSMLKRSNVFRSFSKPHHIGALSKAKNSPSRVHNLASNNGSTIRMQALTRNKATIRTSQEDKARRNLRRLTGSPHRRSELILSLGVHSRWNKWSPDYFHHRQHMKPLRFPIPRLPQQAQIHLLKMGVEKEDGDLLGPGQTALTRIPLPIC